MRIDVVVEDGGLKPTKGSELAAGYDLYSLNECTVQAKCRKLINVGFKIKIPPGYYGRVAPRSGLASKKCIDIGAGVIDADYRGVVYVLVINNGTDDFIIQQHDRIAQLIIEKIAENVELCIVEDLDETMRGDKGFGSSGK